jgi:hypothetical protein
MRKLQTPDVFNALRAISKANLKEEIKPIIKKAIEEKMNIEDAGIEGVLSMLDFLSQHKCEQAFYEVLSGPFEMTADEVKKLDLVIFVDNIETLSKENDLKRFFTLLAGLITKKQ